MKSMHLFNHHFIKKQDRVEVWLQAFPSFGARCS